MSPSATQAWEVCVQTILDMGIEQGSRDGRTRELIYNTVVFDMRYPFVMNANRNINFKYVAAEAHWTILGSNRMDFNDSVEKTLSKWSSTKTHLAGGYGPAFCLQMPYIIDCLRKNPETRQAVITIWERSPHFINDMPCTVSMQFLVRKGKMHTVVSMRSSDAWLGLPNDMSVFAIMTASVMLEAKLTGVELGNCYICAGSRHLYTRDLEAAANCVVQENNLSHAPFEPPDFPTLIKTLASASSAESRAEAKYILTGV